MNNMFCMSNKNEEWENMYVYMYSAMYSRNDYNEHLTRSDKE